MKHSINIARRACEAAEARQAVVVLFDGQGGFAVVSYGETKAECAAVRPLCNELADRLKTGRLPAPFLHGDLHETDHE